MGMSKLSIITVSYNSEETIEDTILSLMNQTYQDYEHIIVDGGSSDRTIQILKKYSQDKKIKWLSEKDNGLWDAMNKGARLSQGDFICFLNSDDVFFNEFYLEDISKYINSYDLDLIYSYVNITSKDLDKTLRKCRVNELSYKNITRGIMPAHPGSFIRSSIFNELKGFEYNNDVPPDFDFFTKFLIKYGSSKAKCTKKIGVKMRTGGISNSSLKFKFHRQRRIINCLNKHGLKFNIFHYLTKFPVRIYESIR